MKKLLSTVAFFSIIAIYSGFLGSKRVIAVFYPATAPQDQPYGIFNPNLNQFLIIWSDCRINPSYCQYGKNDYHDIFGQIININGNCQGNNIPIKIESANFTGEQFPAGVYNPNKNEYLLVWQGHKNFLEGNDSYFQQEGYDIWGQRISSSGQLIGGPFKISKLSSVDNSPKNICYGNVPRDPAQCDDNQWHPRIAYSPTSRRYLVVWHDGRMRARHYHQNPGYWEDSNDKTTFKDIYGQILDDEGNLVGENFPVSLDPNNNDFIYPGNAKKIQQYPDIVYDSKRNRFLVVWEDARLDPNPNPHPLNQQYDRLLLNIYGGIFDTNGNKIGENFLISLNNDQEAERYPKIALSQNNDAFLVVWQAVDKVTGTSYPSDWVRVKARAFKFDSQGNPSPQGNPIIIESQAILHDRYLDESYPPRANVIALNNKFLVSWEKKGEGRKGIWLTTDGEVEGSPFLIQREISGSQIFSYEQGYLLVGIRNNPSTVVFRSSNISDLFNCPLFSTPPTATPSSPTTPTPSLPLNLISSIGLCHQVSSLSNPNITWAYTSSEGIWKVIEPQRRVFNWRTLDEAIERAYRANKKVWIQVLTDDPAGTIPDWALAEGMHQFPDDYGNIKQDRPVQWDPKYLEFLEEILDAMAQRYDNNNGANAAVEAIIMMAGGHYGEMALHGTVPLMKTKYLEEMARVTGKTTEDLSKIRATSWPSGLTYIPDLEDYKCLFDYYYVKNTMKLIDIYAKKFKNKALVLQVGSTGVCDQDSRYVVGNAVKYAIENYGGRVWLKQNGWGNFGSSDYFNGLFSLFKYQTRITREVGHVNNFCYQPYSIYGQTDCSPVTNYECCKKEDYNSSQSFNTSLINNFIAAGGSSLCFQSNFFQTYSPTIFPAISNNFSNTKRSLENNYQNFYINSCPDRRKGDINCDSFINEKDLKILINNWESFFPDFNNDLKDNESELTILLKNWK